MVSWVIRAYNYNPELLGLKSRILCLLPEQELLAICTVNFGLFRSRITLYTVLSKGLTVYYYIWHLIQFDYFNIRTIATARGKSGFYNLYKNEKARTCSEAVKRDWNTNSWQERAKAARLSAEEVM